MASGAAGLHGVHVMHLSRGGELACATTPRPQVEENLVKVMEKERKTAIFHCLKTSKNHIIHVVPPVHIVLCSNSSYISYCTLKFAPSPDPAVLSDKDK